MTNISILKFKAALNVFNAINDEMPIQQIRLFLEVAENVEIKQSELIERLGMNPSSLTRNLMMLGLFSAENPKNPSEKVIKGYDLIDRKRDIYNPRSLVVFLTKKGLEVLDKIESSYQG